MRVVLLAATVFAVPQRVLAWGERGHNAIARVAAMTVLEGVDLSSMTSDERRSYLSLRDFFRTKALQLGHLANIPDIYWRGMGGEVEALNAPTHFLNADAWTDDISSLPLDYALAKADAAATKSRIDGKPVDLFAGGTVIWRAQQLFERMEAALTKAKAEEPGTTKFKTDVQQALVYGGLMAHFVGDASQPYHNTLDHDGYATGEGGIHSFFESAVPNAETPSLEINVYLKVPASYRSLAAQTRIDAGRPEDSVCALLAAACLTRALSARAYSRLPEVRKADKTSVLLKEGSTGPALRKTPDEAVAAFRPVIEEQLALSAAALARLWREAWLRAGRPDLAKAQGPGYALTPAFVEVDYDPEAAARMRAGAKLPR